MRIRFIYVYRDKHTDRAVYVGSAFDVKERDRQHIRIAGSPFDREIRRRGREAFTLEIVEAFRGESTISTMTSSVPRENQWMDVLGTFRTEHGFNFARAGIYFYSDEHREASIAAQVAAQKIALASPEARALKSSAAKLVMARPGAKESRSKKMKEVWGDPETKALRINAQKVAWDSPEARAAQSARATAAMARPEVKAAMKASLRAAHGRPDVKARMSAASKANHARPEVKEKHSASAKKANARPEYLAKWSASIARKRRARELGFLPLPLKWQEHFAALHGTSL